VFFYWGVLGLAGKYGCRNGGKTGQENRDNCRFSLGTLVGGNELLLRVLPYLNEGVGLPYKS